MIDTVALWAPDIEPPEDWLVPAILYQDKIATFAPEPYLDDRDGRASRRIKAVLGDLYEPVSLSATFSQADQVEHALRARLPSWIETAWRLDPKRNGYIGRWAERAAGFDERRSNVLDHLDEVGSSIREAQREEDHVAESIRRQQDLLSLEQDRLAAMKGRAGRKLEVAKLARKEAVAPLVEQVRELGRQGRGLDRNSEEYHEIRSRIYELQARIDVTKRDHTHPDLSQVWEIEERIRGLHAVLENLQAEFRARNESTTQLLRQRAALLNRVEAPWAVGHDFTAGNLWNLPRELDTIAIGKIHGRVFEFLASSAGMWVASRHDRPYTGTLVGPRFVIEEVMMIVATHVMEERDNYVLMLEDRRRRALSAPVDWIASAAAVSWLLPVPRTSDIEAVRLFRENHADELRTLRKYIQTPLSAAESPSELRDAVQEVQVACQCAAVEITRALELERRVGLKYIRGSVVSEIGTNLRDFALAAGLGTVPILGAVMDGGDPLASAPAGFLVTGVTLTAATTFNFLRARRGRRRVPSPFLYSYEVLRASERWRGN